MYKQIAIFLALSLLLLSCKKDPIAKDGDIVNTPSISAFLPASAAMGAEVRIAGRAFNEDKTKNIVKFNGIAAEVIEASASELKVIVPTGATTGKISVTVGSRTGTSLVDFTVTGAQLAITEVTPERSEGGNITIKGSGFVNSQAGIHVKFGNLDAVVQAGSTETQLVVAIPQNLPAGSHDVTVSANSQTVTKVKGFHLMGWLVKRIAGTGAEGSADGAGMAASFKNPQGMATDRHGNIFLIDENKIRKIAPDHTVTTVAGTGDLGNTDGEALTEATFRSPSSIAVDGNGNIYVADEGNHVIRKIGTDGMVTTLAGTMRYSGQANGIGTAALFNKPRGIAVDQAGAFVYVADWGNGFIRRINTSTKEVITFAGKAGLTNNNGTGTAAGILFPGNLAIDAEGMLYVCQSNSGMIRKINTTTAEVTTFVNGLTDMPNHIAFDENKNVYVLTTAVGKVSKYDPNGQLLVQNLAGSQVINDNDGAATQVSFRSPAGFAVLKNAQNKSVFYIADSGNKKIKQLSFE